MADCVPVEVVKLSVCAEITPAPNDLHLVSVDPAYDGSLLLLWREGDDASVKQQNKLTIRTCSPVDFIVTQLAASYSRSLEITGQDVDFCLAQLIGDDSVLLVHPRAWYRSKEDFDENASLFDSQGTLLRTMCLGDGIQHVRSTSDGLIWTSYSDEGVGGNRGWPHPPIGAPGLRCWDDTGTSRYEFKGGAGLNPVVDCYALNVATKNDTWLYYYTGFPLVRVRDFSKVNRWDCPIAGAQSLAVCGTWVLISGGHRDEQTFHLMELVHDERVVVRRKIRFASADGTELTPRPGFVAGNGPFIHIVDGEHYYRVSVLDLC